MAAAKDGKIGFIGGGNMAEALVKGLLAGGRKRASIKVAEPLAARRRVLRRRYQVEVLADNLKLVAAADIVVLAIKPQAMDAVLAQLGHQSGRRLFVSIAAGVSLERIEGVLGAKVRVVRVMPNTPCLVGRGMSVLCAGRWASSRDLARARRLFAAVGHAVVVDDEKLMDAVTALSGSGPAYVSLFAEALIKAGAACGLDRGLARTLAYETIAGGAEMLTATGKDPAELRRAVSSPGGTTVAGLAALEEAGFAAAVQSAVKAAARRSRQLGRG